MLQLALAMATVLTCWALLSIMLVGLGLLVPMGWPRQEWPAERIFAAFWLGWVVAIAVLQAWHLFAPVAPFAIALLIALGGVGLALSGGGLAASLGAAVRRRPWTALAMALLVCWLSNRAIGPPVGDSALYHLGAIRWFASYPVVPGLANVVRQFGFNGPSLLWAAALEVGPLWGRSSHIANSILVAALGARSILGLARCVGRAAGAKPADLFNAVLLPVVVGHAVTLHELRISSPDPDSAAALTALAAATELVAVLTEARSRHAAGHLLAAALLGTLTALLKLSLAPFGVLVVGIAVAISLREVGTPGRARLMATWLVVALALGVPWLARGVILSGLPFYPLGLFPVSVDWRLPETDRVELRRLMTEHSVPPVVQQLRLPGEGWLRPWLEWQVTRIPELAILPAALVGLGLALVGGSRPGPARKALWLFLPGAVTVVVWLAMAPHPRFAYGVLWACAAAALTAAAFGELARIGTRRRTLLTALLLVVPIFPAAHRVAAWTWRGEPARALEAIVLGPGEDRGFHPTPREEMRTCVTRSGLVLGVPQGEGAMWDAPLPSASVCDPRLFLRHPGDLGRGFGLDR